MEALVGMIIAILISAVISGFIIWIVSRLNLGLHVDSFWWAMLAGLFIGIVTNLIMQVVPVADDIVRVIIHLVISAGVIFLCGAVLTGVTVKGYVGALIAAVAIAVVGWLLALVLIGGATLVNESGTTP